MIFKDPASSTRLWHQFVKELTDPFYVRPEERHPEYRYRVFTNEMFTQDMVQFAQALSHNGSLEEMLSQARELRLQAMRAGPLQLPHLDMDREAEVLTWWAAQDHHRMDLPDKDYMDSEAISAYATAFEGWQHQSQLVRAMKTTSRLIDPVHYGRSGSNPMHDLAVHLYAHVREDLQRFYKPMISGGRITQAARDYYISFPHRHMNPLESLQDFSELLLGNPLAFLPESLYTVGKQLVVQA